MRYRIISTHEGGSGAEETVCRKEDEGSDQAGQEILAKVIRLRDNLRYGETRRSGRKPADRRVHAPLEGRLAQIESSREGPDGKTAERPKYDSREDERKERN